MTVLRVASAFPDPPFNGTAESPQGLDVDLADFAAPYLVSGQALAVDPAQHPDVHGLDDLATLTIGVQEGNTSEPIARRLVEEGRAAAVRVYPYDAIRTALADLSTDALGAVMKLAPVLRALAAGSALRVIAGGISREPIALATAKSDPLLADLGAAQAALEADGTLGDLRRQWTGSGELDQSGMPA